MAVPKHSDQNRSVKVDLMEHKLEFQISNQDEEKNQFIIGDDGVNISFFDSSENLDKQRQAELDLSVDTPDFVYKPADFTQTSTDDLMGLYLRETSKVPLLTHQEEINLAQRIERARYARQQLEDVRKIGNSEEIKKYYAAIQDGIRAREHLIKANTRLVISVAKKYTSQGLPLLDLIQEGNLGLMKAIEKFDYRRGFRFSTYATWWIRQTVSRSIADQSRTIRLPVHMSDRIRKMNRISREMEQILERPPTIDELAEKMDLSPKKVAWIQKVSRLPISLETPFGDDDDSEIGMFIEDESTPTPAQNIYQTMLTERINEVLATLTPREARILRMRFGLDSGPPHTLEEVGQKFGLTRERIRQIEGKALRRLRHPSRARQLSEYL